MWLIEIPQSVGKLQLKTHMTKLLNSVPHWPLKAFWCYFINTSRRQKSVCYRWKSGWLPSRESLIVISIV